MFLEHHNQTGYAFIVTLLVIKVKQKVVQYLQNICCDILFLLYISASHNFMGVIRC